MSLFLRTKVSMYEALVELYYTKITFCSLFKMLTSTFLLWDMATFLLILLIKSHLNIQKLIGVSGHDFALVTLYWAGDNLG